MLLLQEVWTTATALCRIIRAKSLLSMVYFLFFNFKNSRVIMSMTILMDRHWPEATDWLCGCGHPNRKKHLMQRALQSLTWRWEECSDNAWWVCVCVCVDVLCLDQSSSWRPFMFIVRILPESLLSFLDNALNGSVIWQCASLPVGKERTGTKTVGCAFVSKLKYQEQ